MTPEGGHEPWLKIGILKKSWLGAWLDPLVHRLNSGFNSLAPLVKSLNPPLEFLLSMARCQEALSTREPGFSSAGNYRPGNYPVTWARERKGVPLGSTWVENNKHAVSCGCFFKWNVKCNAKCKDVVFKYPTSVKNNHWICISNLKLCQRSQLQHAWFLSASHFGDNQS